MFNLKSIPVNYENFVFYSELKKQSYDKKRMIESNQISIKNEFTALKRRVVTRGQSFKDNYLIYKGNN